MPSFSQRTLFVSLSAILLIFLTALTLTPRPDLNTLSIPSPFARSSDKSSPPCSQRCQQLDPISLHAPEQQQQQQQQPTWLIATISAYTSQRRRNIIRATWQTLYQNPAFTTRFVIAKPSPLWRALIQHENDTYGDLIVLDHLTESAEVANTIKSVEFLKHILTTTAAQHTPWDFVSKIDDDSFLSAQRFYEEFLLPRLQQNHNQNQNQNHPHPHPTTTNNATLIARRLLRPSRPFSTPGGQFYTLSWSLVHTVASTYTSSNPTPSSLAEDVLIGRLLYDAQASFDFVELDDTRAFDVSDNGSLGRLGKDGAELGPMDEGALNPHKMKDDEMYLRVAGLFGREGFVGYGA